MSNYRTQVVFNHTEDFSECEFVFLIEPYNLLAMQLCFFFVRIIFTIKNFLVRLLATFYRPP